MVRSSSKQRLARLAHLRVMANGEISKVIRMAHDFEPALVSGILEEKMKDTGWSNQF